MHIRHLPPRRWRSWLDVPMRWGLSWHENQKFSGTCPDSLIFVTPGQVPQLLNSKFRHMEGTTEYRCTYGREWTAKTQSVCLSASTVFFHRKYVLGVRPSIFVAFFLTSLLPRLAGVRLLACRPVTLSFGACVISRISYRPTGNRMVHAKHLLDSVGSNFSKKPFHESR